MKLLWVAPVAIGLALVLTAPIAAAETRTPAQATAHALDELANCRAQNRPDAAQICPTETPTPTLSPTATLTPIPAATPTDMPTDAPEPTVTPLPALPAPPPGDDPAPGYTRPLGNGWLELALPQGRWAVYQADDCAPQVDAWREAWLTTADDGEVDLNATGVACGLVAAVWQSDAPCALDDQGVCQLVLDASYWDMLGRTPTAVPSDTLDADRPCLHPASSGASSSPTGASAHDRPDGDRGRDARATGHADRDAAADADGDPDTDLHAERRASHVAHADADGGSGWCTGYWRTRGVRVACHQLGAWSLGLADGVHGGSGDRAGSRPGMVDHHASTRGGVADAPRWCAVKVLIGVLVMILALMLMLLGIVVVVIAEDPWLAVGVSDSAPPAVSVEAHTPSNGAPVVVSTVQTPVPTLVPAPGADARIQQAISYALTWLGVRYSWGGCGRSGIDCSCFVQQVMASIGISVPRVTTAQIAYDRPVARDDLRPGDTVFFDATCSGCGGNPTHEGLYLGGGLMIDAGDPVQVNPVFTGYYAAHNPRAGRPPGL